jgi:hypothetical protein
MAALLSSGVGNRAASATVGEYRDQMERLAADVIPLFSQLISFR